MRRSGNTAALLGILGLLACTGEITSGKSAAPRGAPRAGDLASDVAGSSARRTGSGGASAADAGVARAPFVASPSVARMLSRAEYDNTVHDLLGDDTHPATRLLPEELYSPYDNDYPSQAASGALIDSLEALANDVAARVVSDATLRARLVPCKPSGPGDAGCFRQVVQAFTQRAFRRPVSNDEVDAYITLLDFATADAPGVAHDFYTAVELLVRSVLQDPEFLYRIELGKSTSDPSIFALDDYEIAARMSYLLWGSTPDAALVSDAVVGRLSDATSRTTVARRMLSDPRAREQLHRFHAMWLGYRAIPQPPELTSAFDRETTALIDRVVFDEPQSYLALFSFSETHLTDFLADHYGLPHPSGGDGWVPYGSSGRAGILSHGSVLSAFSKFSDTSPTQRGKFVRTRLLCQEIPKPPPTVKADQPPGDKDAVCKYDRYLQHRTDASCASCHDQMDPIGFGLENYDIAGVYRAHDDGLPACTIAGQGELVGVGTFSGPAELGRMLVDHALVQPCIVRQLFQFMVGRPAAGAEAEELTELGNAFADRNYDLVELIVHYVASDAFALRMEPQPGMR